MNERRGKCPHPLIQYCPLYVAAHIAGAGSCMDGKEHLGGCAVDRGLSYRKRLADLLVTQPDMVRQCQIGEAWALAGNTAAGEAVH